MPVDLFDGDSAAFEKLDQVGDVLLPTGAEFHFHQRQQRYDGHCLACRQVGEGKPKRAAAAIRIVERHEVDANFADGDERHFQCHQPAGVFDERFIADDEINIIGSNSLARIEFSTASKAS